MGKGKIGVLTPVQKVTSTLNQEHMSFPSSNICAKVNPSLTGY